MMNKKLVLCVMLALGLVLAGTGYAYWTDTLNVTTKATTGDFDVTFVDLGAYAQYKNEDHEGNWSIIDGIYKDSEYPGYVDSRYFMRETNTYNDVFKPGQKEAYYARAKGYNSVEMDAKLQDPGTPLTENYPSYPYGIGHNHGDTISIELLNMYPGYAQAFRSDIINIGSIAAKLSTVDVSLESENADDNDKIKDLIGVALLVEDELYPGMGEAGFYGKFVKLANQFAAADKFTLGGVDFVRLSALKDENIAVGDNLILAPYSGNEHRADLFIGIAVDPDAEGIYTTGSTKVMAKNDDASTQNKGVQIDIKFGWDQFNEGHNPDTTNRLELQN